MEQTKFEEIMSFDGTVEDVQGESFSAFVIESGGMKREPEFAVVKLRKVDDDDLLHVVPGAIFRWVVLRKIGSTELVDRFSFKPLHEWSDSDIEHVGQDASQFDKLFEGDRSNGEVLRRVRTCPKDSD
jgi:hypothetical protein